MKTRTSNTAAIAAAVASSHILGDGGVGVSAFVAPTGGRASLVSKSGTSYDVMGGADGTARYAASASRSQLTMDLSSLESKLLDAPAKSKGISLPKVDLPDIKTPDVKVAIPDVKIPEVDVKIPEVAISVPDVSLPSVVMPSVDLPDIDLSIPPEVQSQIQSLLDKLSPQVQALLNYVASELSASWAAYVAKLTGGDSPTITATGWSALILVAIAANTAARGGAEAKKKRAEEAAAAAAAAAKKTSGKPFVSGLSVPKGVSLQEVADVGKRLASGGGTAAVRGGAKAKASAAAVPKKQIKAKPAPTPAPVAKKTPVVNPLANKRSEILAAKNKKKAGTSPFASFGAKKATPVKKKVVVAVKPFQRAKGTRTIGNSSFSKLIADFQSKDEEEQKRLIGAGVAALFVGGAALGGGGGNGTTAPPTPKPKPARRSKAAPTPENVAPAAAPIVEEVEEVKVAEEPAPEPTPEPIPVPEPVSPPPAPIVVESPSPAPAAKPTVYESKIGKESYSSKLLEPIGGPSSPSPAPVREIRPAPPALTKEPWFKKSMDEYLKENAAEGDAASNAPLIAAGLLGLAATRSTLESNKELREQTQDAMDILEAADNGDLNEADVLIQQLDAKIAFFKDDDDLREALETVRDNLLEIEAKKKSLDA